MLRRAHLPNASFIWVLLISCFTAPGTAVSQQPQVLGSVVGRVWLAGEQPPVERVLVSLIFRGAPMDSVYTDSQGNFGFYNLNPNLYVISIEDAHYLPIRESATIESHTLNPVVHLNITLTPRSPPNGGAQKSLNLSGNNPNVADAREYSARFPKHVLKEFEKGVKADHFGKTEEAVRHYRKALQIAPDFYPAHNNLGSSYLRKADLLAARGEFEEVIRLNQSDAAAYFNLSNICMLLGQLADAHRYLDEGMRRQPDSAFGNFLMGSLNLREGDVQVAEAGLRRAIELNPAMPQARLQLVNLLLQRRRNSEAISELHEFVAMFPDNAYTPKARQLLQRLQSSNSAAAAPN